MSEAIYRDLLQPIKGKIRMTTLDPSQFHDLRVMLSDRFEHASIRMLYGNRIRTNQDFLKHFSAAFHWPSSRPETWAGFTTFLADLHKTDAGKTPLRLLMISHAAECLQDEQTADSFERLLQALVGPANGSGSATFSVLLQEHRAGIPILQRRLAETRFMPDRWNPNEP